MSDPHFYYPHFYFCALDIGAGLPGLAFLIFELAFQFAHLLLQFLFMLAQFFRGFFHAGPDDTDGAFDFGLQSCDSWDGAIASLEALPEVVDAVGFHGRAEVYLDGGVRRGSDVVDGDRARRAGRPRRTTRRCTASRSGGDKGVAQVLEIFREETENALALLGCRSPAEVSRAHVTRA